MARYGENNSVSCRLATWSNLLASPLQPKDWVSQALSAAAIRGVTLGLCATGKLLVGVSASAGRGRCSRTYDLWQVYKNMDFSQ